MRVRALARLRLGELVEVELLDRSGTSGLCWTLERGSALVRFTGDRARRRCHDVGPSRRFIKLRAVALGRSELRLAEVPSRPSTAPPATYHLDLVVE